MATDPVCGMQVDETEHALKVTHHGKSIYFCSKHCLEKYTKEHGLDADVGLCESCIGVPWHKQRIFRVGALMLAIVLISYTVPQLRPLYENIIEYTWIVGWAVLLGLFLGGLIDYFIPREYISKMLSKKEKKTIVHSVVLGFLMSACSHGILALAIQLYKKGASIPSVIAFLMAAPWANFAYTVLLFSLFGAKSLYIIFAAILIALTTGFAYQMLDNKGLIEANPNTTKIDKGFSIRKDARKRIKAYEYKKGDLMKTAKGVASGSWNLATMIVWWIMIGILAASVIGAYVPGHIFMEYAGPTAFGLMVTLIVATIIEVCSEGSSPIAFEIFRQTGAFGNSFVFLMAGVATDYTEIGLLWTNIGKKTALWLPAIAGPQIIVLGYLFNVLVV
ncbi:permease [Candidatus Altiarchaeota archaeon]